MRLRATKMETILGLVFWAAICPDYLDRPAEWDHVKRDVPWRIRLAARRASGYRRGGPVPRLSAVEAAIARLEWAP